MFTHQTRYGRLVILAYIKMVKGNRIFRCLVYLFWRTVQERVSSIPPDSRVIRSMQYPAVFTSVQVVLVNLLKRNTCQDVLDLSHSGIGTRVYRGRMRSKYSDVDGNVIQSDTFSLGLLYQFRRAPC